MNKPRIINYIAAILLAVAPSGAMAGSSHEVTKAAPADSIPSVSTVRATPVLSDSLIRADVSNAGPVVPVAPDTIEEFERDVETVVFVPKDQWITGLSVSFTQSNQNRYQFLVLENLSGDTYSFKVSPMLAYAVKDDLALGLKFAYQRSLTKLETADIVLDAENDYSVEYLYRLAHNYYATAFMRNYFSIGHSKRFGFFNEVQLMLGGGQSKLTKGSGDSLTGVYERNFTLDVGLAPGLAIFLSDYSAIEVNIGVLGFSYTNTKSVSDRVYVARRKSKSANFRINLFSITFGMAFYI